MKTYAKKIKYYLEVIIFYIYYTIEKQFFYKDTYKVSWDSKYDNFGDIITPFILDTISTNKITQIEKSQYYPYEHYFVIGSILDRATSETIVWGSGFISEDSKVLSMPKQIYAVRGPKTRKKFLEMGIDCPEVYGDPALLLPRVYNPKVEKKYKLGIIPHYVDKNQIWLKQLDLPNDVIIIDIQVKNPKSFIDKLLSCEKIASSSLHGLITADAYSIPSLWVEFSDNVKGEGFKFYDYFLSVKREEKAPFLIKNETEISDLLDVYTDYKIDINLDKLLMSCPFIIRNH